MHADEFRSLVERANLAPSVHNTQPTRWRLDGDGSVSVLEDVARRLSVADPEGRDMAVSHGSAIEGFAIACADANRAVSLERATPANDGSERGSIPVARLTLSPGAVVDPLSPYVTTRRSYRGTFAKGAARIDARALTENGDVTLAETPEAIARIAELNDRGALRTYRDRAYRRELVSWLRLSRRDPKYSLDGLSAEAMEMSPLTAAAAGVILAPRVFEALDAVRIAPATVAEAPVIRSAQTIAFFHRPEGEDPLLTGRRFYRLWLEFEQLGLSAAPMSVLADDPEIRAIVAREFGTPPGHRLVNAFRLGVPPARKLSPKARLANETLIVAAQEPESSKR